MRKAAFTLAEVLITLGIIGVVAAITLPTINQNRQDNELITQTKKVYADINNAILLSQQDYGVIGDNSLLFNEKD
uniref:type II secretion system protein n=1 Tax=Candidatus Scatousia sp. TaxID=3085663 RepID=UPI0040253C9A